MDTKYRARQIICQHNSNRGKNQMDGARIDDASEFGIYWRIVMPLAMPGIPAVATLEFTRIFNDYWALILLQNDEFKPVTAGLVGLQASLLPIGRSLWPPPSWLLCPPKLSFSPCNVTLSAGWPSAQANKGVTPHHKIDTKGKQRYLQPDITQSWYGLLPMQYKTVWLRQLASPH